MQTLGSAGGISSVKAPPPPREDTVADQVAAALIDLQNIRSRLDALCMRALQEETPPAPATADTDPISQIPTNPHLEGTVHRLVRTIEHLNIITLRLERIA